MPPYVCIPPRSTSSYLLATQRSLGAVLARDRAPFCPPSAVAKARVFRWWFERAGHPGQPLSSHCSPRPPPTGRSRSFPSQCPLFASVMGFLSLHAFHPAHPPLRSPHLGTPHRIQFADRPSVSELHSKPPWRQRCSFFLGARATGESALLSPRPIAAWAQQRQGRCGGLQRAQIAPAS